MATTGDFYDLGLAEKISDFIFRDNGNELAFDVPKHSDGYAYTVSLKRHQGSLFKGTAISQPGGEVASLTCRVYEDTDQDLLVITGSGWQYPDSTENHRWFVEIQKSD